MSRRKRSAYAAGGLGGVIALVAAFALAASPSTRANEQHAKLRAAVTATSLDPLRTAASTLDRPRGPADVLPPKVADMLSSLPGYVPGSAEQSLRVMAVEGAGALYVAPLSAGFAILSSTGFAGTAPMGLIDSNPIVGGTAVQPDGKIILLAIASDNVVSVTIRVRGVDHAAAQAGNGFWWISPESALDPDDLTISARLVDGRVIRVS